MLAQSQVYGEKNTNDTCNSGCDCNAYWYLYNFTTFYKCYSESLPSTTSVPVHKPLSGIFMGVHDGFHNAEGNVKVVSLTDGSKILRLDNFKSTNGPNVHVYLSTDKHATDYVDLGKLKANNGNQNYNIPAGTDITKHNIVLIWCKDFSV